MIHPIVRMYDTADKATAAVNKVKGWGLTSDLISVISVAAAGSGDGLQKALMAANIVRDHATIYAREAPAGATIVVVRSPFGVGVVTADILDSCHPISKSDPTEVIDGPIWDDAAPLSSALHLPVISPWRPFGGMPAGGSSRTLCSMLGIAELSSSNAPTTEGMMKLLSDSKTPFSSLLNLPLLR